MAAPATKRRKLEHRESEEESEGSFAGFDDTNDTTASDQSAGEEVEDGGDASMNGFDSLEEDEDLGDDDDEDKDESDSEEEDKPRQPAKANNAPPKPAKRPASALQDGIYTSETFKSNIFKLQVDDLLDQVKFRYGKKEAPAENAMRTLKSIIEQIPNREPLYVCSKMFTFGHTF